MGLLSAFLAGVTSTTATLSSVCAHFILPLPCCQLVFHVLAAYIWLLAHDNNNTEQCIESCLCPVFTRKFSQ